MSLDWYIGYYAIVLGAFAIWMIYLHYHHKKGQK